MTTDLLITEVGPRDGLQNIATFVPTETKVALVRKLLGCGFRAIEVGSFVSPRAVPQMRDTGAVFAALGEALAGVRAMALVPNLKGAELAEAAGVRELELVISMTERHNQANVRRTIEESIAGLAAILRDIDPERRLGIRIGLSCTFDCPFEGRTPEANVLRRIEQIVALREGLELMLADTTGMALPGHVGGLARRCLAEFGTVASFGFHGHDTSGFGVANALAAYEAGIRSIDAAVAGLGGCPFAPGATGNVATEDVVYAFHRLGVETGIDLDRLLDAAEMAASLPDGQPGGHVRAIPRERLARQGVLKRAA